MPTLSPPRKEVATGLALKKDLDALERRITDNLEVAERVTDEIARDLLAIRGTKDHAPWKMKLDANGKPYTTFALYYAGVWEEKMNVGLRQAYQLCQHVIVSDAYLRTTGSQTAGERESRAIAQHIMQGVESSPSARLDDLTNELAARTADELEAERQAAQDKIRTGSSTGNKEEMHQHRVKKAKGMIRRLRKLLPHFDFATSHAANPLLDKLYDVVIAAKPA